LGLLSDVNGCKDAADATGDPAAEVRKTRADFDTKCFRAFKRHHHINSNKAVK